MHEFHYKYIKSKFDANLLFTDTDGLVYGINLSIEFKFFEPANKKVIGKMKNGFKGKIISEIIGLNSKMYSLIAVDDEENKKAK